jgi:hypothetical protein
MPLLKELPDEALPIIANYITETIRNPHTATNTKDLIAHLILLPKQDPQDLKNTRPITMCTAMYKLTAQVFSTRIAHIIQTNNFLLPTNVGFTPHGETHHLIMPLQIMYDLNHTRINTPKYKHIHTLMVDLSQAYDRVPWWALQQTLRHLQFPTEMIQWLANATEFTQTHLKFPQGLDPSPLQFTPTRGIKQGCPLSPILFAIFNDTLLRWIQIKSPENMVESHNMTALGFADDMGLISTGSPDNIINQVRILHEWATLTDQKINTAKTQILTTDTSSRWQITNPGDLDQAHFQKVSTFKYLGVQVHAIPGEQAEAITTTFMQEKCAKFTNRLLKLKYLPIDNLTKIAATKSAIQTLIPYGIYATHPKSIPIKHLQTI